MVSFHGQSILRVGAVALLLAGVGFWSFAAEHEDEEEKELTQAELPAAVLQSAQAEVPGGTFAGAESEQEDGALCYEVAFTLADGRKVELELLADGTVLEREEKITEAALPAPVRTALAALQPAGTVVSVEKKTVTYYEIKRKNGERYSEITLNPAGKKLRGEEEHEDHEDADEKD
jgi:hypothetical protein